MKSLQQFVSVACTILFVHSVNARAIYKKDVTSSAVVPSGSAIAGFSSGSAIGTPDQCFTVPVGSSSLSDSADGSFPSSSQYGAFLSASALRLLHSCLSFGLWHGGLPLRL